MTEHRLILERLGGYRPVAEGLGLALTTVQSWQTRNRIPIARFEELVAYATSRGVPVEMAELVQGHSPALYALCVKHALGTGACLGAKTVNPPRSCEAA